MFSLLILLTYLLGAGMDHLTHLTFFRVLPGLGLLFYTSGSLLLSLLYPKTFNKAEKIALSVILSIAINAVATYSGISFLKLPLTSNSVGGFLVLINFLLFLLLFISHRNLKLPPFKKLTIPVDLRDHWPLLAGLACYLAVYLISFLIYPFIPESDGYSVIHSLKESLATGFFGSTSYRPLFRMFGLAFALVTGLDLATLFKYLLPLIFAVSVIPFYLLAKKLKLPPWAQFFATLLPVTVPVIVQETQYVRPQSFAILNSFISLWLLIRFSWERNWSIYILALLLILVGISFHEFNFFLLGTAVVTALPELWVEARRSPSRFLLASVYLLVAFLPYAAQAGSLNFLKGIVETISSRLGQGSFTWWFLDSYTNVDGNNLGWPGLQGFLYYGYNLGLTLPFLILLVAVQKIKKSQPPESLPKLLPVWAFFGFTFFFSEISPRFGAAYLPDRSWLFTAISLIFLAVPLLSLVKSSLVRSLFMLLCCLSLLSVWTVTYLKQGWITNAEYQAALWLKQNTPANSQIVSQHGNGPLIETYAQREILGAPHFFFQSSEERESLLARFHSGEIVRTDLEDLRREIINEQLDNLQRTDDLAQVTAIRQVIIDEVQRLGDTRTLNILSRRQQKNIIRPIYVLYSQEKFRSLYSQREWWRKDNAFGADLGQMDALSSLKMVYNKDGITIWQYQTKDQ